MMSQLHGLLTKALPTPLLMVLLLVLTGVRGQDDVGIQNRQDFETNFGGPPLGDNGFVGANSLPRPQGLIDLGSFGDAFAPSDVFQNVDQTFNQGNQLTHVTANIVPTPDPTPNTITSFTSPISSKITPTTSTTHSHVNIRRQRAPFHPRLPLQQDESFDRESAGFSYNIISQAPRHFITSSSNFAETTINNSLESATFQPSPPSNLQTFQPSAPSNDFNKHISSLRTHSEESENFVDGTDDFKESSAFQVFRGSSENGASSVEGPVHNDVLTVNFEEGQHSFQPQGVQGSQQFRRPGHNKRRPSGPSRRPIRQSFRGRLRQKPNNLRRDQPSYLSLLLG